MMATAAAAPAPDARTELAQHREAFQSMGINADWQTAHYFGSHPVELWTRAWTITTQDAGVMPFHPMKWCLDYRGKMAAAAGATLDPFPLQAIMVKSRDTGSSTWACAEMTHKMLWHGGSLLIAADKQEHAQNLLEICRQFVMDTAEVLPHMVPPILKDNATELVFGHPVTGLPYKRIKALASGESVGRSFRGRWMIATEMAFWKWPERTWSAVQGALVRGSETIIESTPQGPGNLYARKLIKAKRGESRMVYGSYDWTHNPAHDERWHQEKLDDLGPVDFGQEHGCELIASGNPIFGAGYDLAVAPGSEILAQWGLAGSPVGGVEVYHWPEAGSLINFGVDTAQGKPGGDYSAAVFLDHKTGHQVAEIWGSWPEDVFAGHVATFISYLGGKGYHCYGGVEGNGCGRATWLTMQALGVPGIEEVTTTGSNKRPRVRNLEKRVRYGCLGQTGAQESGLQLHSTGLVDECFYYQDKGGGKSDAMDGYHDDRVDAAAIAADYLGQLPAGLY